MKIFMYKNRDDVYIDAFYPAGAEAKALPAGAEARALPAVLICPGGGYHIVGTTEGRPVSDKFTDAGYAAFILHYTVGGGTDFGPEGWAGFAPARDLRAALRLLKERAGEYGVDPDGIVLAGFSAGGHLCAGSCFSGFLAGEGLLPKALILTYPMGGGADSGGGGKTQPDFDVARMPYTDDPKTRSLPVFMWHARDDAMVPFAVAERLDARLTAEGIPHVFLAYDHGVHARPFFDPSWFSKALEWLAHVIQ